MTQGVDIQGQRPLGTSLEAGSRKGIQLFTLHLALRCLWSHNAQERQDTCLHGADMLVGDKEHKQVNFKQIIDCNNA